MSYPGRDGYVLSHDPEARITTRVYDAKGVGRVNTDLGEMEVGANVDEHSGSEAIVQVTSQDCGPIMDMASMQRQYGTSRMVPKEGPRGMTHVGFIPNFMIPTLHRMGILQDAKRLREFMDSPEFAYLRTNPMALSAKGMKRKYGSGVVRATA